MLSTLASRFFLLALVVIIAGLAFLSYTRGVPGSPERAAVYGVEESSISVFTPEVDTSVGVVISSSLKSEQSQSSDLELFIDATDSIPKEKAYIVIRLSGTARVQSLYLHRQSSVDPDKSEWVRQAAKELGNDQIYVIDLAYDPYIKSQLASIHLHQMQDSIWTRENARILTQTPHMFPPMQCSFLNDIKSTSLEVGTQDWGSTECRIDEKRLQGVLFILDCDPVDVKLDLASEPPSDNVRGFTWSKYDSSLEVRATFASISMEAAAQRFLFISGVLAGLAGGLIPLAAEKAMRRRKPTGDDEQGDQGRDGDTTSTTEATLRSIPRSTSALKSPAKVEQAARSIVFIGLAAAAALICRALRSKRR